MPHSPIWWGLPCTLLVKDSGQSSEAHSSGRLSCYMCSVCAGTSDPIIWAEWIGMWPKGARTGSLVPPPMKDPVGHSSLSKSEAPSQTACSCWSALPALPEPLQSSHPYREIPSHTHTHAYSPLHTITYSHNHPHSSTAYHVGPAACLVGPTSLCLVFLIYFATLCLFIDIFNPLILKLLLGI